MNNLKVIILLAFAALFIGLGAGGAIFSPTLERNDLIKLDKTQLGYGEPIKFSISTPTTQNQLASLGVIGGCNAGAGYKQYALAGISLSDAIISIDGRALNSPINPGDLTPYDKIGGSVFSVIGTNQPLGPCGTFTREYGQEIQACWLEKTKSGFIVPATLTASSFDDGGINGATNEELNSVIDRSLLPTSTSLVSFSVPQYLPPGPHTLQIYYKGAAGGINIYGNCKSPSDYEKLNTKIVATANFEILQTPTPITCTGTIQNGLCIQSLEDCPAGQIRSGDKCIYPISQENIAQTTQTYPQTAQNNDNIAILFIIVIIGGLIYILTKRRS
jgi:LPXTG-motif cell wall-anchored protein